MEGQYESGRLDLQSVEVSRSAMMQVFYENEGVSLSV